MNFWKTSILFVLYFVVIASCGQSSKKADSADQVEPQGPGEQVPTNDVEGEELSCIEKQRKAVTRLLSLNPEIDVDSFLIKITSQEDGFWRQVEYCS